jgi:hypothetical protein
MIAALCKICRKKAGLWTVPSGAGADSIGSGWIRSHYELGTSATFWGKEDVTPKCETVAVDPIEALAWA